MKKTIIFFAFILSMISTAEIRMRYDATDFPLAEEGLKSMEEDPVEWRNTIEREKFYYYPVGDLPPNSPTGVDFAGGRSTRFYPGNTLINVSYLRLLSNAALYGNFYIKHDPNRKWSNDDTLFTTNANLYGSRIGPSDDNSDFPEIDNDKTSQIHMRSEFTDNGTKTDLIRVAGNVYGHIRIVPVDGELNIAAPFELSKKNFKKMSDPVAIVFGESKENSFYGKHPTTSGEEIYLIKVNDEEKEEYLKNHADEITPQAIFSKYWISKVDISTYSIFAWGEHLNKKAFIPEVVPAVTMKTMISKANMLNIDTLHQRMGQRTNFGEEKSASKTGMWTRLLAAYDMESGNQFGYNQTLYGIQVGKDYELKREYDEYTLYSGVEAVYIKSGAGFMDTAHNEFDGNGNIVTTASEVAKGSAHLLGLGLYQTRIHDDGQYTDLLTEIKYVNNSSNSIDNVGASNEGVLFTINGEYGKDINRKSEKLGIEPQAQVTYTIGYFPDYTFEKNGQSFTIKQGLSHTFISRSGIRFFNKNSDKYKVWGVANVYYIPRPNTYVEVGTGQYTETFKPVYLEIGAGAQSKITDTLTLYGDLRYKANVIHNGYQNQNIKGILGIKTEF